MPLGHELRCRFKREDNAQQTHQRHHHRIGQRHPDHAPIGETDQRRQRGGQQEQERGLTVGSRYRRQIGAGVNGDSQQFELFQEIAPDSSAALAS